MLEVMTDCFKLSHDDIFREINGMFQQIVGILKSKSVNYQELKGSLTPSTDKHEIILVFDSCQIESSWYGGEIFKRIIPLFDRRSSHSILCGDYIDQNLGQERLYDELVSHIVSRNPCEYRHSSQFFFVYINNLSKKMVNNFDLGLKNYSPYSGFVDVTYSSFMKTYASVTLCNSFIKHKTVVISGHEDDRDNDENVNMSGYAFEENNYKCLSLKDSLFGIFLSYKVERPVFGTFSRDTDFALNSISTNVLAIDDFIVEIGDEKLAYLIENKTGRMKKSGLIHFNRGEIEELIRRKISSSYIYNMTHLKQHGTTKFNIVIEKDIGDAEIIRLLVALEYMPDKKKLRLITMM